MNLLVDPWVPILRASGQIEDIAPWQLTQTEDPVLSIAARRPDFNGALLQFLIGLLQTACTPANDNDWANWLEEPPSPTLLKDAFEPYAEAFEFNFNNSNANSPNFLQDFAEIQGKQKSISNLLIEAPGEKTLKENKDHFVKRDQIEALCPPCAAIALFTLQTNAPSGGAGHRTSLRGGGPLTALVALDPNGGKLPDDLWRFVWLNVSDRSGLVDLQARSDKQELRYIFPWLAPTRTSEKSGGADTTPSDAHPLQAFWGMPRRIHLESNSNLASSCGICNRITSQPITHFTTQNYGINYTGPWQHPLSPHSFKDDGLPLPKHPQPGGITYRHWLGLNVSHNEERASLPVRLFTSSERKRRIDGQQLLIHAFGYDMDNMKARCWYQATFPLFEIAPVIQDAFFVTVEKLIEASTESANRTRSAVKEAWFKRPSDAKGDTSFLTEVFFSATEIAFFDQLRILAEQLQTNNDDTMCRIQWRKQLHEASIAIFEHWADSGDLTDGDPRRICEARKSLNLYLFSPKSGLARTLEISPEKQEAK